MDAIVGPSVEPGLGANYGVESLRLKRSKKEIEDLVALFTNAVDDNPRAAWRVEQLFALEEEKKAFLASIARDIPVNDSPIEDRRRCCNWEGFLTTKGRYAVAQTKLPETNDPWVTFANRLIVFSFAKFKKWEDLALVRDSPFYMKCRNPRCVRLSHILYKKEEVAKWVEEEKKLKGLTEDEANRASEFSYTKGSSSLLSSSDFSSMESSDASSDDSSSGSGSSDDSYDSDYSD